MCYRCHFCRNVAPPGQIALKYTIYRTAPVKDKVRRISVGLGRHGKEMYRDVVDGTTTEGRDILSEVLVCAECKRQLDAGVSVEVLRRKLLQMVVEKKRNGEVHRRVIIPLDPLRPEPLIF